MAWRIRRGHVPHNAGTPRFTTRARARARLRHAQRETAWGVPKRRWGSGELHHPALQPSRRATSEAPRRQGGVAGVVSAPAVFKAAGRR